MAWFKVERLSEKGKVLFKSVSTVVFEFTLCLVIHS